MTMREYLDLLHMLNNMMFIGQISKETGEKQIKEAWELVKKG